MPSTRLQLEGPNLEDLLAQVRRQYGEGARILQAEKVRSGGLGGFFAREHFQIDVEIDDELTGAPAVRGGRAQSPAAGARAAKATARSAPSPAPDPGPTIARPGTARRAYAEGAAEPAAVDRVTGPATADDRPANQTRPGKPAAPARSVSARWASARSGARSARSATTTGAAATGAAEESMAPIAHTAPVELPRSDALAAEVGPATTGTAATGAARADTTTGTRAAKPATRKRAEPTVSADPTVPTRPVEPATDDRPLRSVLDLADSLNEQELGGVALPREGERPDLSTETASFSEVLARLQQEAAADMEPDLASAGAGATAAKGPAKRAAKQPAKRAAKQPAKRAATLPGKELATRPSKQLAKRGGSKLVGGLPADLLAPGEAGFVDGDAYVALLRWLRALPAVPPPAYSPGQVLAVVGEPERALRTAVDLADELGMDESSVFFASPHSNTMKFPAARRLSKPGDLAVRRARWAKRPHGTIVVVDAPLLLRPAGWAKSALSALAPTFVWGAVSATTKVADIGAWAERVGQIDALAVDGLEATLDPAAILTGTIPVGMVDGRRSSAQLWAAIITDRLAE